MINVPREQLGGSATVALGNTLRYMDIMPDTGFQTVSWWRARGLEAVNIVGQGWHDYNVGLIPCTVSFSGTSTRVVISLRVFVSNSKNHTFRWAVASERCDSLFMGAGPVPADPRIRGQGSFTPSYDNGSVHWQDFSLAAAGIPQTFFIYLWRANTGYGNIHISGDVSVTVYKESAAADWRGASPWIWTGSSWHRASPYITVRNQQDQKVWRTAT